MRAQIIAPNTMTDKPKSCHLLKEVGAVKSNAKTLEELGYTASEVLEIKTGKVKGSDMVNPKLVAVFEWFKKRGYTIIR